MDTKNTPPTMPRPTASISFEVTVQRSSADIERLRPRQEALRSTVSALAEIATERMLAQREQLHERLVEDFLQGVQLTPLDVRRARMTAEALKDIFLNAQWLSTEQMGEQAELAEALACGTPAAIEDLPAAQRRAAASRVNRWKREGRLFSIPRQGRDWYPRYAVDAMFRPLPIIQRVVEAFGEGSPLRIASWMESPNAYLDGQRPRELLEKAPQAVLHALEQHRVGALHG
ncbi:antitoxin Xre/MbcA/ParS toxin-binding domain-containing protein [uncultured Azohydromonas sp.]|uniref:antitoxin Xre/MbcA/ParS toxin-binding domain-containing protein n=1 Tax=uncultured Azohydromonas sp. TaxID=487342 RepID=UPI002615B31E|nr:antitoxin Xre/MbcA/ParS toxin-binding domain-containing protein [uncultured Azohydromonas sp.]